MSEVKRYWVAENQLWNEGERLFPNSAETVVMVKASDYAALTLTWREEKPTVPGWYWYRDDGNDDEPIIVKVWLSKFKGEPRWYAGDEDGGLWINGPCWAGEWAGPLAPPQDGTREG